MITLFFTYPIVKSRLKYKFLVWMLCVAGDFAIGLIQSV